MRFNQLATMPTTVCLMTLLFLCFFNTITFIATKCRESVRALVHEWVSEWVDEGVLHMILYGMCISRYPVMRCRDTPAAVRMPWCTCRPCQSCDRAIVDQVIAENLNLFKTWRLIFYARLQKIMSYERRIVLCEEIAKTRIAQSHSLQVKSQVNAFYKRRSAYGGRLKIIWTSEAEKVTAYFGNTKNYNSYESDF